MKPGIQKIVLTGGFGFIGQSLLELLLSKGFSAITVVDNLSAPVTAAVKRFPQVRFVNADVVDLSAELIPEAIGATWVHLAALAFIPDSFSNPLETMRTNVLGTLRICHLAKRTQARRMITISSSEVYGSGANSEPLRETSPTCPISTYAMSKLLGEQAARQFELADVPWVVLRPFNAFGPHATHPYFIPEMIRQCLKENTISVGNLETVRDFTHVRDTAAAIMRSIDAEGIAGETINVCSGRSQRMKDVLQQIKEICGATSKPVKTDQSRLRPLGNDPPALVGCRSKAEALLGWTPHISFEEGLQGTIDDYSQAGEWLYEIDESTKTRGSPRVGDTVSSSKR